jgi:transcriptional regulator with GAF, ATPase, and Fis domain
VRTPPEALRLLEELRWPGQVPQLEGVVLAVAERAHVQQRLRAQRTLARQAQFTQRFNLAELDERSGLQEPVRVEVAVELLREHLLTHELAMATLTDGAGRPAVTAYLDPGRPTRA